MKPRRSAIILIAAMVLMVAGSPVANADGIVTFQAESYAALGSNWTVNNGASPAYITVAITSVNSSFPGATNVASYSVTFPSAGTYQLYGRVLVGPGAFNSDSMFYATSFGNKSPTTGSNWEFVNGLASAGYTAPTDVVTGTGSAGTQVWKWVNLSQFAGNISFTVSAGSLTQTFQIGGRELGLELDQFAFGTVGTSFTVSNLDTGTLPPPPPSTTLTNYFPGPDGMAIHRFNPLYQNLNLDGANPAAGLVMSGGVLCGTTLNGGAQGSGTAFYLTPDGTSFNAFHSFTNAPDSGNPQGDLVVSGGSLLGTTIGGGASSAGSIFVGNTNGSVAPIRSFAVVSADEATNSGGASPGGLLALSGDTLYGTAAAGGVSANGTIFSLTTNGSAFSDLHDFSLLDSNTGTNTDGAFPCGGLVLSGGTLYGTASGGGAGGAGVVFSINTGGGGFAVLHYFTPLDVVAATNTDGAFPSSGLVLSNGVLYGTTLGGGPGGKGVIFSLGTDGTGFAVLHNFTATDPLALTNTDGASPCGTLALSSNVLYGTTSAGGAGASGTVFSVGTNGAQFQTIYAFTPVDASTGTNRDGAFPVAGVLPVGSSLYGTAFGGGPGAEGTVFSVALPYPPAVITNIVHNPDNSVTLYFLGGPNTTNVIQATPALGPTALWQNVSTNTADGGGFWQFTDPSASQSPVQFYRSFAR